MLACQRLARDIKKARISGLFKEANVKSADAYQIAGVTNIAEDQTLLSSCWRPVK